MRVIAGEAGGRRLDAPPGRGTRPTSDRVREALFSSVGAEVEGATVLDLFAGSGALGIEALSRGAAFAVFVDDDRRAVRTVRANLRSLGMEGRAAVVEADAGRFCGQPLEVHQRRAPGVGPFDLVFCDPPYVTPYEEVVALLERLAAGGALAPGALVVVEREHRAPGSRPGGPGAGGPRVGRGAFVALRDRVYGDTLLRYLRLDAEAPSGAAGPGTGARPDPVTDIEQEPLP